MPQQQVVVEALAHKLEEVAKQTPLQPRVFALAGTGVWSLASGRWEPLNDGNWVWRMRSHAQGATSQHFRMDGLALPQDVTMFVYAPGGADIRGPYTQRDLQSGSLWTPVIRGEDAVVEIIATAAQKADVRLASGQAFYGFFPFWKEDAVQFKEGNCHVDVACQQAQAHAQQVRAIARIQIQANAAQAALCTGNLINNSQQNRRPLMLTANHCINTAGQANSLVAYWNFQRSSCGGGTSSLNETTQGATLLANSAETDFSLVDLGTPPPLSFNVFYAGWDRSSGVPASTFVIHHPEGTEKRYSEDFQPPVITNLPCVRNCDEILPIPPPEPGDAGSALQVLDYDIGTTEPGSSGAALFNPLGQIIGQLSQGAALCGNNEADWYGRLAQAWEGEGSAGLRLKDWLDPANTGLVAIAGLNSAGSAGGAGGGGTGGTAGVGGASGSGGAGGNAGSGGSAGSSANNSQGDSGGGCTLRSGPARIDASLAGLLVLALAVLLARPTLRRRS